MEQDEWLDHMMRHRLNSCHRWHVNHGLNPPPLPEVVHTAALGTFPVEAHALLIKLRAIQTGLEKDPPVHVWDPAFTLEMVEAMIKDGVVCHLCHLPPTADNRLVLDRIVHDGPYTPGNVRPVHRLCNEFRGRLTDPQMYEMVRHVVAHLRGLLQLAPGAPLTVQAAVAALTAPLGEPFPEMSWEDQLLELVQQQDQQGNVLPVEDDHRVGTQPLEVFGPRAFLKVLTEDHPERLNHARFQWFMEMLPGDCYLCGAASGPPTDEFPDRRWGSIDRVDSNGGYGPHNGRSCCVRCNMSKYDHPLPEHLSIIFAIHKARFGSV